MTKENLLTHLISLVIGCSSAFLTAQVSVARLEERMIAVEQKQKAADEQTTKQQLKVEDIRDSMQSNRERLVSVETKIDVLLMQSNPKGQ